jgi:hypothetical protein
VGGSSVGREGRSANICGDGPGRGPRFRRADARAAVGIRSGIDLDAKPRGVAAHPLADRGRVLTDAPREHDRIQPPERGSQRAQLPLLECGVCGASMVVVGARKKNGRRYPVYGCAAHRSKGSAICSNALMGLIRFGGQSDYAACLSVKRLSNSAGLT